MKKQEILYNLNSILRDVYHIADLDDMIALPSSKPENGGEISIKYDRGKSTMVLSSTKRDIILAVSSTSLFFFSHCTTMLRYKKKRKPIVNFFFKASSP